MDDDIKYLNELGFDEISNNNYCLSSLWIYSINENWKVRIQNTVNSSIGTIVHGLLRNQLKFTLKKLKAIWIDDAQSLVNKIEKLPKIGE